MINEEIIIKRLSIIKYLYKIGLEQSYQSEAIASFSILSFHDSIEMYLKLLCEHKNIKSDKFVFIEYWTSIPDLTLRESMKNLNARRVNIKHKGLLPSKTDIEVSRVNTTDFFEQNTKAQFNIEWKDVSLISLVQFEKVKDLLENAQLSIENNNLEKSIELSALAFDELLYSYETSKQGSIYSSPFFFGKSMSFNSSFFMGIKDKKMAKFVDSVKESIEGIQKAIKIVSLGIDYKKFAKFNFLTPNVTRTMGNYQIAELWGKKRWTKINCQFCVDFVLDSTLKLQEFDFDINELVENDPPSFFLINEQQ